MFLPSENEECLKEVGKSVELLLNPLVLQLYIFEVKFIKAYLDLLFIYFYLYTFLLMYIASMI